MDFKFNSVNGNQQQINQAIKRRQIEQEQMEQYNMNGRLQTAQFGLPIDLLGDYQERDVQQSPQSQTKTLTDDYLTRPRSQQKTAQYVNNISGNNNGSISSNSNGSNNIVSALIPNIVYDFINFWQKEPLQQNEQNEQQQQKETMKFNQMEEAKHKAIIKNNSILNDNKQQLKDLGVKEEYILNGEKYIQDIQAGLKSATFRLEGKLILTNYKLIFLVTNGKFDSLGSPDFYHIQLMLIQSCERTVEKKGNQFSYIDIECKDVRKYQFRFNFDQNEESFEFMTKLIENAFNKDIQKYPAFLFKKNNELDQIYKGWNIYDVKQEFERMELPIYDPNQPAQANVQYYYKYLSNENKEICETYPPYLVVPYHMSDEVIKKCSKFRSRERLPVLTFGYRTSIDQKIPVTLWRCSQCKTGLNSRSQEDEQMLRQIGDPSTKENRNQNSVNVHIYDARPFMNAVGNKLAGKGYENTNCYKNCEIYFLDIHNIHKVRDSFNKIVQLSLSVDQQIKWFKEVDSTQWLEHISTILSGAVRICQSMIANNHVVVHCSDGWDRTSQLCSLAQIFLDPHYRTIEGFCTLVQKDWVYFGHQFNLRQGHGIRNQNEENSPIFLQFLDCVHQVITQYPLSFEFNEQFLVDLAFSSYNCLFGTFLKNCYHELIDQNIPKQTVSVFSWILSRRYLYENPFYIKGQKDPILILKPDSQHRSLKIWNRFFLYYQFQKLDEYKIDTVRCRFNEDNIAMQYKKSLDVIQYYENIFKELKISIPRQKQPTEIANCIKEHIIQDLQVQQQQQQQYDEQEIHFIFKKSKIQSDDYQ